MNPLIFIKFIPYAAGAVALIAGLIFTYNKGAESVQSKWDRHTAEQTAAQLQKNNTDLAKLKKFEEIKNANIAEIDRLHSNNHALWLRIPPTACNGVSSVPNTDNITGTGKFPTQSERDLAEAKRQLDEESYRADKIVEDCRVLNDFLKSSKP